MRTAISIAVITAFATLAGCAVIVVPDDGSGNGGMRYSSAFGSSAVQGNGQQATERRDAASSDGLDINGPMQVEVRVGDATSLQVEGDSNLLPMLRTDASGGMLRVWIDGNIQSANPLRVIYTTPQLRQIDANGSGRLTVTGLNGGPLSLSQKGSRQIQLSGSVSRLDVRVNGSGSVSAAGLQSGSTVASLTGSGRLDLGRLNGDTLNLDIKGSGGVNASGAVRSMNVRLYGSGSADLAGLTSQSAELVSYGSGSISAGVSQSLVADATGSGHVTVYGNPAQRSISGKRVSVMQ
ncbi:MAG: head GIN domain-containing protein [Pseudomonadota bacterium]